MQFTAEHEQFRKTVRDVVENEINPYADEWERAGIFPARELFPKLGALGILGLEYDPAFGGQGADHSFTLVYGEEMGRCNTGGVAMAISVQTDMATPALARFGSDELKERYLRPAIAGEMIAAIAVTEPDAGSDVANLRTRATRDGDEWVVNGTKLYITNGTQADWLCLLARTSDEGGSRGMSQIVVPTDTPGFSVSRKLDKLGQRSSDTAELSFVDVRVPVDHTIGEVGRGFQQQMAQFQNERLIASYMATGNMRRALDRTDRVREVTGRLRAHPRRLAVDPVQAGGAGGRGRPAAPLQPGVRRGHDRRCRPLRHRQDGLHRKAQGRPPQPRHRRLVDAVPRRHRLHGGDLDRPLLPRLPPALHRRRRRRGHAPHHRPARGHQRLTISCP